MTIQDMLSLCKKEIFQIIRDLIMRSRSSNYKCVISKSSLWDIFQLIEYKCTQYTILKEINPW